ncbi:hypothetical protein F5X96DRAFT_449454 [Biscogniauxia mediterranea]|nr:hypothetical protein F5X96DRAFT_449454 [Biscogniauxia mediterranea]
MSDVTETAPPTPQNVQQSILDYSQVVTVALNSAKDQSSNRIVYLIQYLVSVYRAIRDFGKRRAESINQCITLLACFIAIFALWPAFVSASDGRKSRELGAWTAKKDFMERCESVSSPSAESILLRLPTSSPFNEYS